MADSSGKCPPTQSGAAPKEDLQRGQLVCPQDTGKLRIEEAWSRCPSWPFPSGPTRQASPLHPQRACSPPSFSQSGLADTCPQEAWLRPRGSTGSPTHNGRKAADGSLTWAARDPAACGPRGTHSGRLPPRWGCCTEAWRCALAAELSGAGGHGSPAEEGRACQCVLGSPPREPRLGTSCRSTRPQRRRPASLSRA